MSRVHHHWSSSLIHSCISVEARKKVKENATTVNDYLRNIFARYGILRGIYPRTERIDGSEPGPPSASVVGWPEESEGNQPACLPVRSPPFRRNLSTRDTLFRTKVEKAELAGAAAGHLGYLLAACTLLRVILSPRSSAPGGPPAIAIVQGVYSADKQYACCAISHYRAQHPPALFALFFRSQKGQGTKRRENKRSAGQHILPDPASPCLCPTSPPKPVGVTRMAVALVGPFRASLDRGINPGGAGSGQRAAGAAPCTTWRYIRFPRYDLRSAIGCPSTLRGDSETLRKQGMRIVVMGTDTILENHKSYNCVVAFAMYASSHGFSIHHHPSLSTYPSYILHSPYIIPSTPSLPPSLALGDMYLRTVCIVGTSTFPDSERRPRSGINQ